LKRVVRRRGIIPRSFPPVKDRSVPPKDADPTSQVPHYCWSAPVLQCAQHNWTPATHALNIGSSHCWPSIDIPRLACVHLHSPRPSAQYLTPSLSNNSIMSLTILPRRVALRSATRSTPWARQFSTVVDDTFSPVSPASAPPPPQARKGRVLEEAVNATAPRFDWTKDEIREIYNTPLMELAFQAVWQSLRPLALAV
jgi:hypothetical protein